PTLNWRRSADMWKQKRRKNAIRRSHASWPQSPTGNTDRRSTRRLLARKCADFGENSEVLDRRAKCVLWTKIELILLRILSMGLVHQCATLRAWTSQTRFFSARKKPRKP